MHNGSAAAGAERACVPGRLVFEAGKLPLALGHAETAAPTADIRRIGGAMRSPARPRMVVPRPECWNADLNLHLAAQALPRGDARWPFAERFHRNPAHVAPPGGTIARLRRTCSSATAARTTQPYTPRLEQGLANAAHKSDAVVDQSAASQPLPG